MIVVWLFLAVPWVCLQFVIVVFPDHTHLLILIKMVILETKGIFLLKTFISFNRGKHKWVKRSNFIFFISQLVSVKQSFSRNICKQWSLMTSSYHDVMATTSKVSYDVDVKNDSSTVISML